MLTPPHRQSQVLYGGGHLSGKRDAGRPKPGLNASQSLERNMSLGSTGLSGPLPQDMKFPLYGTQTAIGTCRMEHTGHLVPSDDRHAPVQLYRSYGEWFEAGVPKPNKQAPCASRTSRFWPYGQDVTKLYQTSEKRHRYQLDDQLVLGAKPYVPSMSGSASLPSLDQQRASSDAMGWKASRFAEGMDNRYHTGFRNSFRQWASEPVGAQMPQPQMSSRSQADSAANLPSGVDRMRL
eukprot:TRINITY_DN92278_c0_g1_i1.p1 TRINITY_DN92278_c0_g1~~TRINITY_DN92278_c0_g1_i1.p1  ORF type:complete len:236 (-),score=26.41 TRINITY_DN92278_c0_g1_i1:136-843(-)